MTKKIALFGHSILRGIVLGDDNRYHISKDVDWQGIEKKFDISIENCSKMGLCVNGGKAKLSNFLKSSPNIDSIILEYGGNDSDYCWKSVSQNPHGNYLPKTDLNQFSADLIDMVQMIREHNIRPILMTLPPIIAKKYFNFICQGNNRENIETFLGDIQIIYRRQELYSNEISKVARIMNTDLVDVRQQFLQAYDIDKLYCQDGIHPNLEGQKLIVKAFAEYFSK